MRFFCVSSSSSTLFYFSCHCLPHPVPSRALFHFIRKQQPFLLLLPLLLLLLLFLHLYSRCFCLFVCSISLLYYCILSVAPFVSCAGAVRWARRDMNKSIAAADIAPVSSRSERDSSRCAEREKSLPLIRVQYQKCSSQLKLLKSMSDNSKRRC